jgi:hypothetical protein
MQSQRRGELPRQDRSLTRRISLSASHNGATVALIQGIRCCLRKRRPEERSCNDIPWIVDAGVNTRIRDERSEPPQWQPRDRQDTRHAGSEGERGR